jgi:hypothetical protein
MDEDALPPQTPPKFRQMYIIPEGMEMGEGHYVSTRKPQLYHRFLRVDRSLRPEGIHFEEGEGSWIMNNKSK